MTEIRYELAIAAINRAMTLIDNNIHDNLDKKSEFLRQTILTDESLTEDEKLVSIDFINKNFDKHKVQNNKGTKRICEDCQNECLATSYCECCIRNYLKSNFSNWTSGNDDIDNLIQNCQLKTLKPSRILEWIPYNKLQNVNYLTKGGCSEIFIADWIEGCYNEWDLKEKQLKRVGKHQVILKGLENLEKANRNWFDEAKSHITISNKWDNVVGCFGITQNPSNNNYMLVVQLMDTDLEKYLQQNNQELTWKKRIQIAQYIIYALSRIHGENAIHRDLHSGNILFLHLNQSFYISDLGFCGPADVPINGTYGKLPYIAPEAIMGNKTTFESDIYSIGILMWEISSCQSPFANISHDINLAMNIVNGMRPKIIPGTPLEYKILMEQCWDSDPAKRPDINSLYDKISEIKNSYNQEHHETFSHANVTNFSYTKSISKVHMYDNLPEPRNATEEEQEVYDSTQYDFIIPDDISDD